ncbi:MAG: xanthine dehydrogenase family protein molybdopterin-binding subunit [Pseudomonadota bacterium]
MHRFIGQPIRRVEDQRLLTGDGTFSDDVSLPGQVYAAMVRSPIAHGYLKKVDATRALTLDGALAVLTSQDCEALGIAGIDHKPVPSTRYDLKLRAPNDGSIVIPPHLPLPRDRVRFVGEAVAIVIGETQSAALDAAERVDVSIEPLPSVMSLEDALAPGAPDISVNQRGNLVVDCAFGDHRATTHAIHQAEHIVSETFSIQRVTGTPLEPRSALATYDASDGAFTLIAGSGGAVRQQREIAAAMGVDAAKLRVISPDVGGNFGTRNRVYVEFVLILAAARQLNRPVKFTASRSESFLSDYQGRDLHVEATLALDRNGRIVALETTNSSNLGAHCVSLSPLSKGTALVSGPYDIPNVYARARAFYTNTAPTQAYRSSGRPEVTFVIERLIEKAAAECDFDPIVLRRQNLVPAASMPYTNGVGAQYDSGTYESNLDRALALGDWDGYADRRDASLARQRWRGRGLAMYVESSTGSPKERAEITLQSNGRLELIVGTQPSGQGHETAFAQVLADELSVDMGNIDVVLGDTERVKEGGGSHSGRSMRHAGAVIALAASDLIESARARLADALSLRPELITYAEGHFQPRDSNQAIHWAALATLLSTEGRLSVGRTNEMHRPVFPNGCAVCEVEIDPDTGQWTLDRYVCVDDVGRCINPLIVEGQTHGATVQGISQALGEAVIYDPNGQPLCGTFLDYPILRADEVPAFIADIVEVLSPTNPLGIKAGGEGGTTPALAAIVNAIDDALPARIDGVSMPMTPYRIWQLIEQHRSA